MLGRGVEVELLELEIFASEGSGTRDDCLKSGSQVLELCLFNIIELANGCFGSLFNRVVNNDGGLNLASSTGRVGWIKTSPVERTLFVAVAKLGYFNLTLFTDLPAMEGSPVNTVG
jgi:hypothetical protein